MNDTKQRLAASLTAGTTELIPYLPYLLQDLWELGGSADLVVDLLRGPAATKSHFKVMDLCCGKGAVSVRLAKELGAHVKGFDLVNEFIQDARRKADEYGVYSLCDFETRDADDEIRSQRGWDAVVFAASGSVLGAPAEMLPKLAAAVQTGGYVVLDESYLSGEEHTLKWQYEDYMTLDEWLALFAQNGLRLLETRQVDEAALAQTGAADLAAITRRAGELAARHPAKAALFDAYVRDQQAETDDLLSGLVSVVWLLQKGS